LERSDNVTEGQLCVLLADDDPDYLWLLQTHLQLRGYKVLAARDGTGALEKAATKEPDLLVLDVQMPDIDGCTVCQRIREFSSVPVILLPARGAQVDLVHGFEVGADDYLTKPFDVTELLMRVQAVLRRSKWPEEVITRHGFKAGPIEIDFASRGDSNLELTVKEFALLAYFMSNPERVLTRTMIAEHVWDYDFDPMTNVIDVYVNYLRKKIDAGREAKLIHTVRGVGYVMKVE